MARSWRGGIVGVVAVRMFVARPRTVFLHAPPDRHTRRHFDEMPFMCWTRETGVVPRGAGWPVAGMKAPGAQMIASVTFIAILATILIQDPTTRRLAGKLGLLAESRQTGSGDHSCAIASSNTHGSEVPYSTVY